MIKLFLRGVVFKFFRALLLHFNIEKFYRKKVFEDLPDAYLSVFNSYYLTRYPDVYEAKYDPVLHYMNHGREEGRSPHPYFDSAHYLANNPDVSSLGIDPFLHFVKSGFHESRNPSRYISSAWVKFKYISENNAFDDITDSINSSEFLTPNCLFDTSYYVDQIGGRQSLQGKTPFEHFLEEGIDRSINPNSWMDLDLFRKLNDDYCKETQSRLDVFLKIHELIERDSIFNSNLIFVVKTNEGKLIQITEKLIGDFIQRSENRKSQNWLVVDFLNVAKKSNFSVIDQKIIQIKYPPKVEHEWQNESLMPKDKILFYCHWDSGNHFATWISVTLDYFINRGFSVYLNTNVNLQLIPDAIKSKCFRVHIRTNSGFDFDSHLSTWKRSKSEIINCKQLVLMNDSTFFPTTETDLLDAKFSEQNFDILGMTRNLHPRPHLQSYFLCLNGDASIKFMSWVDEKLSEWLFIDKSGLISTLETQIDQFSKNNFLKSEALFEAFSENSGNPTHSSWDLLATLGVPIYKVEILRMLMAGPPGDTELLKQKLENTFPKSQITTQEMLSHARHVEISRNDGKFWYR